MRYLAIVKGTVLGGAQDDGTDFGFWVQGRGFRL